MLVFAVGCKPEDEPNNGGGIGTYNGHEYVDLGLPSGTLWATCNVGATTPEGYGDYFAWGETESKTTYSWGTYKYANGSRDQILKYCNVSNYAYYGFTDTLTVLQHSDDAATANWGHGWRMPTMGQWDELYQNTTPSWTTLNGVNGRMYTASNGNSLFLPAAGRFWDDVLVYDGLNGYYWSSSLIIDFPYYAWSSFIFPEGLEGYDRSEGIPVRAVRSEHQN